MIKNHKKSKLPKKIPHTRHTESLGRVQKVALITKPTEQAKSYSCVTCRVLPVTCHKIQQPQPHTLLLLSPPLCTVGWFAKTPKPQK